MKPLIRIKPVRRAQRGLIGVLLLVTIAVMAVAVFSKNIWGDDSRTYQQKVNREALQQAKAALLEYVEVGSTANLNAADTATLGRFPCPNQDGNGDSESGGCGIGTAYKTAGQHSLGLLPWSTLNIPPLRDAAHQCLWYAVDGRFKVSPTTTSIAVNSDSFASFSVVQPAKPTDTSLLSTTWATQLLVGDLTNSTANNSPNRVVAVIMASGAAGGSQTQTSVGGSSYTCGLTQTLSGVPHAETSAPNFLKYYSDANATTGQPWLTNQSLLPSAGGVPTANSSNPTAIAALKTFVTADTGQEQLNDQIIWITAEEFSKAANKRVARLLGSYLNAYYDSNGNKYPTAALTPGGTCVTTPKKLYQGYIPGDCGGNQIIPISPNRLAAANDVDLWLGQAHYAVSQSYVAGGSGTSRIAVDGGSAAAILLMRGRALSGQTSCTYSGSINFYSASNTMANCIETPNKAVVTAAIAAAASTSSYVTNMSTIQYSYPNASSSNDYMILFTRP